MKRKPDAMTTMFLLFCLGLAITGFSSMSIGSDEDHRAEVYSSAR